MELQAVSIDLVLVSEDEKTAEQSRADSTPMTRLLVERRMVKERYHCTHSGNSGLGSCVLLDRIEIAPYLPRNCLRC